MAGSPAASARALLTRLRRDTAGNALIVMAGMLSVLIAIAGCAIDASRLYVVNTRLHQACDAGVLAGRRAMTDTAANTPLDSAATTQAQAFFNNNFPTSWFGTGTVSFTPAKTSTGQVSASAQVVVPMTLLQIFGFTSKTIAVTCEASFDTADTDIMFVLDTTGSMACLPSDNDTACSNYVNGAGTTTYNRPQDGAGSGNTSMPGYPGSTAYYVPERSGSRIAALRTAVVGFYDTLQAAIDPSAHVRYGFVTYTSTVNAGKALMQLSPAYIAGGSGSGTTSWSYPTRSQNNASTSNPIWQYQSVSYDITGYVAGNTVDDPSKVGSATSTWAGCVEAPGTTAGASTFDQADLPDDLDPDAVPSSAITTQWKPMWPDLFYARNNYNSTATATSNGDDNNNHPNVGINPIYLKAGYVTCGKPVARLSAMTRAQVSAYVNATDFRPVGGTYHDTGMIWGSRLLSPTGIFAADTATWPGHQAPSRVIVFFTDGAMAPSQYVYGMYGNEYYDRRVSGGDLANLTAYHNARFLAVCGAAKARNINVWTVSIASAATAEMQACATTPAQALATTDGTGLATAFQTIARQVAMLRLTR